MIFRQWREIIAGRKTQTRQLVEQGDELVSRRGHFIVVNANGHPRYAVDHSYVVVPKRGQPAIYIHPNGNGVHPLVEYHQRTGNTARKWCADVKAWLHAHGYTELRVRITSVGRQRLQDISDTGALAEGVYETAGGLFTFRGATKAYPGPVTAYAALWDSIHQRRGERWIDNSWVWVMTFSRGGCTAARCEV